ncbi:hypothetical protein CPC16_011229 [Podila verticillata]|nr:hypothetical protein CPC16_011229 [Podila verticillata]
MVASDKSHSGLRVYRLLLAFVALIVLGLNIHYVVSVQQTRRWRAEEVLQGRAPPISGFEEYPYTKEYVALLVPDISMLLMFLLLVVSRLRFNNQKLHSICRVLFSLTLAFGLVYYPALMINAQVQIIRRMNELLVSRGGANAFTFENMYFCSMKNVESTDYLHMCRVIAAKDMLSFIAGFLVILELVFAGRVGEIGIH